MIQDGIFQMLDPYSLQPFASFQLPLIYTFTDYHFDSNFLFGFSRDNLMVFELDHELKRQKKESAFEE